MKKILIIAGIIILLAAVTIGMSASDKETPDTAEAPVNQTEMAQEEEVQTTSGDPASATTVIMDKLDFQQKEITVKKGSTVTWKNQDSAAHNVVFEDDAKGKVENGKLISKGEELKHTFEDAGTYDYFCEPHPFMKATVIVTE